jgi:hypothetical protein
MQNELDVVRDISVRLDGAGIAYMLTGSMAMNYYAQPRMTRDIDVVVALTPTDAGKVVDLFSRDYYVTEDAVRDSIAGESIFNLIHNESVIKVDCIVRKKTPYRRVEFDRRKQIRIEDFDLDREQGRPDHFQAFLGEGYRIGNPAGDVRNLAATGCDVAYVENWTRELGLTNLWQQCRP